MPYFLLHVAGSVGEWTVVLGLLWGQEPDVQQWPDLLMRRMLQSLGTPPIHFEVWAVIAILASLASLVGIGLRTGRALCERKCRGYTDRLRLYLKFAPGQIFE